MALPFQVPEGYCYFLYSGQILLILERILLFILICDAHIYEDDQRSDHTIATLSVRKSLFPRVPTKLTFVLKPPPTGIGKHNI